jgi:NADPH:quinone reductase-like Zn-dependent oxidoreductase
MKAIVWTAYGPPDVLQLRDVEKPAPKDNDVLIKVFTATVTLGDCEMRAMKIAARYRPIMRAYAGLLKPTRLTILGQELAGEVESVGKAVTCFKPGDAVFAPTLFRLGAYAEYACLPESYPVLKPACMTFEEAATIPTGGINGLHLVRASNVQAGQSVLINGAGGSIGTYAVQIAKSFGAEVTAVDSAEKLDMLRTIGADHVIDYAQQDFTQNGETYDVIIDVVGKSSFSRSIKSLKPGGCYVLGNPSLEGIMRGRWTTMTTDKKVVSELADYRPEDFAFLKELLEARKIKPVIDRCYPLEETAEAHRYVEAGRKKGNVVIIVERSVD